jgi:hypothetical protein
MALSVGAMRSERGRSEAIMEIIKRALLAAFLLAGFASWGEANTNVLMDEAHGQRFLVERQDPLDLSKLAAVFAQEGLDVKAGRDQVSDETLTGVEALVISGAFAPFTDDETAATKRFLERGGRVCVMLHIAPPLSSLLKALGVSYSNGVIREQADILDKDPLNFRVTRMSDHPVTRGLQSFNVYGAWALLNHGANVSILARTGDHAWVDLNGDRKLGYKDAVQSFAVAVGSDGGKGSFVVFGDDAIFQNQFLSGGNETLARNLARWIAGAASKTTAGASPSDGAAQ